jgi:hypothetical protein
MGLGRDTGDPVLIPRSITHKQHCRIVGTHPEFHFGRDGFATDVASLPTVGTVKSSGVAIKSLVIQWSSYSASEASCMQKLRSKKRGGEKRRSHCVARRECG